MKRLLIAAGIFLGTMLFYSTMYNLNRKFSDNPGVVLTHLLEHSRLDDFDRARLLVTNSTDSVGSLVENQEEVWRKQFSFFFRDQCLRITNEDSQTIRNQRRCFSRVDQRIDVVEGLCIRAIQEVIRLEGASRCMSKDAYDLIEQTASEFQQEGGV